MTSASRRLRIAAVEAEAPDADGRRRRSQDSRARIVQAMLELVQAGQISPGAEEVALRAKVGLRTVFRHFKDVDSLYREMSSVIEAEVRGVIDTPLKAEGWRARLSEIAARRAAVYERITPFKRAAEVHRHGSPDMDASQQRLAAASREVLARELPLHIAEDRLAFEALDLWLSFEAWDRLRRDQGLSARQAASVLDLGLGKLLG